MFIRDMQKHCPIFLWKDHLKPIHKTLNKIFSITRNCIIPQIVIFNRDVEDKNQLLLSKTLSKGCSANLVKNL